MKVGGQRNANLDGFIIPPPAIDEKFELMLMRCVKAYSSSGSVV